MSQPQGQLSADVLSDINAVQGNILQLQTILNAQETPDEDKPYIRNAILEAQLAVANAGQGRAVDLTPFQSLDSMLRGGLARELRGQQISNIRDQQTALKDQIRLIDEQIMQAQLPPMVDDGRVAQLEAERAFLNQQVQETQAIMADLTASPLPMQSRDLMSARFMTPEAELMLNTRIYDKVYVDALKQGKPEEEARAEAEQAVQRTQDRIVLDPSGQQSLLAQIRDPVEQVDFAAGTMRDPETGRVRGMTFNESMLLAMQPQVLGKRDPQTGQVKTDRTKLPTYDGKVEEYFTPLQTIRTIAGGDVPNVNVIESIKDLRSGKIDSPLDPVVQAYENQDILVESPMSYTLRMVGVLPSAATAVVADALTYTIDEKGNPVDPTDFSYKINQLSAIQAYNEFLPSISMFQPVQSDRAWANASTTLNAAAAGVAEGVTVFEVKKVAPNLNMDIKYYQDKIASGTLTPFEYASIAPLYLADTAAGVGAFVTDMLMPIDVAGYFVRAPARILRLGVKGATRPAYEVADFLLQTTGPSSATQAKVLRGLTKSSDEIQKALVRLERFSETEALLDGLNSLKSMGAKRAYRNELNMLVDEGLQGGYQSSIKKASIRSMQDTAAREVADNLTELQLHRLENRSINRGTSPFVRTVMDEGYNKWHTASRQKDNPFAGALAVSDEIANDVRVLRQGGVIPKASLYGSAFRSNLMRAGVKHGKYRGKLLESYRTNNPDAVPDDFYRILADDPEVLQEAMYRTLRDQVKDELFARLPVNQILVGGNRIINIGHWSRANQEKVANIVTRLTQKDQAGRLIADSDDMIDAFVAGIGLDEVRSSQGLQKIVSKLDNNLLQKLTADEYRIYEQAVLGHAWDTAVAESRQPILMTQTGYIEAAEMRSNSVAQARARTKAIEYANMVRQDARGAFEGIVSVFNPSIVLKTRQQMLQAGQEVVTNRAYLSSVKIKDPKISKTPKPYLDLQYRVNNLRSTAFDQIINDIEHFMKQDKDGTVVLNRLLVSAFDEQVKVKFSLVNSRYEREYRHLRKSMSEKKATEVAYKRAVNEIKSEQRFNTWLEGFDIEDLVEEDIVGYRIDDVVVPKTEAIETTLYNAVVEEQLFVILSRFFDNIWFVPQTRQMKTGQFVRYLRDAAAEADGLSTALLQKTAAKIVKDNPALKSTQLRASKVGGDTDLAWTEGITLLTLSLRGEVVMKAGIDELLMLYPSMYMDLVLTPIQKLQKAISPRRVTSTTIKMMFETEKHPLFYALNNFELQESFRLARGGEKFANQPAQLQAAKMNFEEQLRKIYPERTDEFYEDVFRASRQLVDTIEKSAEKVLMMSSRDLGRISTSMIDGMVKAKVANKGPSRNLTKIVNKGSYGQAYQQFTYDLHKLLEAAGFNFKAQPKYTRAGIAGVFGLNGAYTGNLADLRLFTDDMSQLVAGTAPLVYVEKEIDNMLRSYGVTIGPATTDNFAAEIIGMYRPYLSVLPSEGVALFMGQEMFKEFENLKALARGDDWTDIIQNYRMYTENYAKGRKEVYKQNKSYMLANFFDILNRISNTGLLGGMGAPNTRYLGVNLISAPLLMSTELGINNTLRSLSWLHADHKFVRGNWAPNDVLMVTRNGQTITYGQYADLVSSENIATTFSAAQFQKTSMSELMRELALTSEFQTAAKSQQFVRWYLDPSKRTRYTMWSHYTDMRLRRAVFAEALYDGLTPQQAATRSREALLDYGKARNSAMEKIAGSTVAFWSFQWMSFKGVVGALWRGKGDVLRILRAQEGYAKQQESYYVGDTREHARIFRYVTNRGLERNEMAVGFYNPAYESMGILIDGMAYAAAMGASIAYEDADISSGELTTQFAQALIDRKPLMPLTNIIFGLAGQYQGKGKLNPYQGTRFVPPHYVALMEMKDPIYRQEFKYTFKVEQVAPREGDPTYKGQAYKFADASAERMFYTLDSLLFVTGLQRRFMDTLKLQYASDVDIMNLGIDKMQYDRGYYSAIQDLYRQTGMANPMQLQMSAALSYELGLMSMTRNDTPEAMFIRAELKRQKQKEAILPPK